MNGASLMVAAVNTVADLSGAKHRYVCWCTYCLEELDPQHDLPARRASGAADCFRCGDENRARLGGLCLVLVPDTHSSVAF